MVSVIRAPVDIHPGYLAGNFYNTWWGGVSTAAPPSADVLYLYPWYNFQSVTIKTLHARTGTGGAGSAIKTGIWANSKVSNKPLGAPLIADNTGQATTASTTNTSADVTDTVLAPGWYWIGSKLTGTLPTMVVMAAAENFLGAFLGHTANNVLIVNGYSVADTYSNDLPTIAEGASFTNIAVTGIPLISIGV